MSTDSNDNKGLEILNGVAARALDDDEYRERLIKDPRTVLREAGMEVREDVDVVIHQNSPDTVHLVLPAHLARGEALDVDDVDLVDVSCAIQF